MPTITQNVADIAGVPDNSAWVFFTEQIRESADGTAIITTDRVRVPPVNGVLTIDLEPGPAVAVLGTTQYHFVVPDIDSDLWSLIESYIAPETPPTLLYDAVAAYFAAHPPTVDWNTLSGKPATIAAGASPTDARTAIDAASTGSVTSALSRTNHTGTQSSSTISDFTEATQDVIGSSIVAGTNVTATYNDAAGTTTIASSGGGTSAATTFPTFTVNTFYGGTLGGSDDTTCFQNTIDAAAAAGGGVVVVPPSPAGGFWKVSQLVMPRNVHLKGGGTWHSFGGGSDGGSKIRQLDSVNADLIIFEATTADTPPYVGPCGITDIVLRGAAVSTAGHAINLRAEDGQDGGIQDMMTFERIAASGFVGSTIRVAKGVPIVLSDIDGKSNGRYTVEIFEHGVQQVLLRNITGDGNMGGVADAGGAVVLLDSLKETATTSPVVSIFGIKSEYAIRAVGKGGNGTVMGCFNALQIKDCTCPITVTGINHLATGSQTRKPGSAIEIIGPGRPNLVWQSVVVRNLSAQTSGSAPYRVYDEVLSKGFNTPSGTVGPLGTTLQFPDLGYIADSNGNEMLQFDQTATPVNFLRVQNANTGARPTIYADGDDTNVDIDLVGKGTGTVRIGGLSVTTNTGTVNLTNKTMSGASNTFSSISADSTVDGTTNHVFTAADDTKLTGIATGATANSSDATLLARANHTGTQTSSTISDFTEAAQDAVNALLAGASGVTLSYDDAANTLTIIGGGAAGLDAEAVRDAIGVAMVGAGLISVTVNDGADTITISTTATANDTDANLKARANHTGTQSADTLTDGTTNKAFLATERTKLTGIATAATANSSDATLLARASHTGTQLVSTISDFDAFANPDMLTVGESTFPRRFVFANTTLTSGILRLTYFTALKTETVTQIRTPSGTTAAATPTLCRVGVYSIDGSGNLTLIASIANDTTLWAATNTNYTRSLSASFSKVRGTRYAVGALFVGTTAPTVPGVTGGVAAENTIAPRMAAGLSSQTDLPSSITVGSLSDGTQQPYIVLLP